MTKQWIAAGLMAIAAGAGQAQSKVSIYGLIDTGVEYLNNVGAAGDTLTRVPTLSGTLPSRLGFRGVEDLGDGLKVVFTLENGFAPDAGTPAQGGRLFGREAFVGLSGAWGTLTFGRQQTIMLWSLYDGDILGPNIYGLASFDNYIPNARADNAIAYRGTFGGLTAGATYSGGRDSVNAGPSPAGTNCAGESATDSRACREWSLMAKYDTERWGVAAVYDRINGGPGAFAGLASSGLSDSRASLNGYVRFGAAKLAGGVLRRDNQGSATPRTDIYFIGASQAVTPLLTVDAELFRLNVRDSGNGATLFAARALYHLSKRTSVYVTAGHIANGGTLNLSVSGGAPTGGNPVAGGSQTGATTGMRHFF